MHPVFSVAPRPIGSAGHPAYLPLYHLHDHDAKKTRARWLKQLEDWATKDLGIKYKVLPDSSYYFSGTVLIAFYVDGDIVG